MLVWYAFNNEKQELMPLDTNFDIEHIYPRKRQDTHRELHDDKKIELLGNKSILEKRINIRASDYRFEDKIQSYKGFTSSNGRKIEGTKIHDLRALADTHTDFQEPDIDARNEKIINDFINFLRCNDLINKS